MPAVIRSMTGYGRGEALLGDVPLCAEVRSVNGRYLELRVRGARELVGSDAWVRGVVAPLLRRGQVEVQLRLEKSARRENQVEIDWAAARSYLEAARELRESADAEGVLDVSHLLALPGVARLREPEELEPEALERAAREALAIACREAAAMRAREGEALARYLRGALDTLHETLLQIEKRAAEARSAVLERLRQRVAELAPELEIAPGRLDQELVLYVDRMDTTEEAVRLHSHFEQFRAALAEAEPVGRKLEFLLQEMSREVNTIGSKGADAAISRWVVELKTELEKLREQVLNVE